MLPTPIAAIKCRHEKRLREMIKRKGLPKEDKECLEWAVKVVMSAKSATMFIGDWPEGDIALAKNTLIRGLTCDEDKGLQSTGDPDDMTVKPDTPLS